MTPFRSSSVGGFHFTSNDVDDSAKTATLRGGPEGAWNRTKTKYTYISLLVRNKVGGNLACLSK